MFCQNTRTGRQKVVMASMPDSYKVLDYDSAVEDGIYQLQFSKIHSQNSFLNILRIVNLGNTQLMFIHRQVLFKHRMKRNSIANLILLPSFSSSVTDEKNQDQECITNFTGAVMKQ